MPSQNIKTQKLKRQLQISLQRGKKKDRETLNRYQRLGEQILPNEGSSHQKEVSCNSR